MGIPTDLNTLIENRVVIQDLFNNLYMANGDLTVATIATASMPNTTNSAPVKRADTGAVVGYVALYANATLT